MKVTGERWDPEAIGIKALLFLAAEPDRLERFLALSGIDAADIRAAATAPGFLGAVLDHLLADETLLQAFAGSEAIDPGVIGRARTRLPGAWTPSDFE